MHPSLLSHHTRPVRPVPTRTESTRAQGAGSTRVRWRVGGRIGRLLLVMEDAGWRCRGWSGSGCNAGWFNGSSNKVEGAERLEYRLVSCSDPPILHPRKLDTRHSIHQTSIGRSLRRYGDTRKYALAGILPASHRSVGCQPRQKHVLSCGRYLRRAVIRVTRRR
jgi:hypothetical protein